jgi:2-polyprenyl-3-methyl-5-hydroxy-6-metoxy-1,4-benzoquinol methylase
MAFLKKKQNTHASRNNCILCKSNKFENILPLRNCRLPDLYLNKLNEKNNLNKYYNFSVYMCKSCGHLQLKTIINSKYTWGNYFFKTGTKMKNNNHYDKYVESVFKFYKKKIQSVLDIGSNDGFLLKIFKKKKVPYILGIDASAEVAKLANNDKIKTINGYFNFKSSKRISKNYKKKFDIITANNVFGHNADLSSFARGVKNLLNNESIFVTEISYAPTILKKNYFLGTVFHEHTSYHSLTPLKSFLERLGLKIIKCEPNELQGGSLVCFIAKSNSAFKVDKSVSRILKLEKKDGFLNSKKIKKYLEKLTILKKNLDKKIDKITLKQDIKLFVFGSSVSSTTFFTYFNLTKKVDFIVDDNPLKQGKYHACGNIPIYPSSYLEKLKNHYGIIFAWEHNSKIVKKFNKFISKNSGFIQLFPKVKIIDKNNN